MSRWARGDSFLGLGVEAFFLRMLACSLAQIINPDVSNSVVSRPAGFIPHLGPFVGIGSERGRGRELGWERGRGRGRGWGHAAGIA